MIRYRCESATSHRAEKHFHHVHRLGRIISIEGLRFRSTRSWVNDEGVRVYWTNTHERVKVRGVNGYANFSGICWGYGGTGPHTLVKLLKECGLSQVDAEQIAFRSQRRNECGVDWQVYFPVKPVITYPEKQLTFAFAG